MSPPKRQVCLPPVRVTSSRNCQKRSKVDCGVLMSGPAVSSPSSVMMREHLVFEIGEGHSEAVDQLRGERLIQADGVLVGGVGVEVAGRRQRAAAKAAEVRVVVAAPAKE